MKDIDYPAGHSMDSAWFGVDKNGHVAMFETGEDGALPIMYGREYSIDDFFTQHANRIGDDLYELKISSDAVNNIISLCTTESVKQNSQYFEGFIILKNGVEWQDLDIKREYDYELTLLLSEEKRLYYVSYCYEENELEPYIENGTIEKGFHVSLDFYDFKETSGAVLLGFYCYEADYDRPYKKQFVPLYPLKVENLASDEKLVKLDNLDFDNPDDIYIQEHVSSRMYRLPDATPEQLKEGYVPIKLSDGKEHLVSIPTEHILKEELSVYGCRKCKDEKKYYSDFSFFEINTRTDYPKVILLRGYPENGYRYENRKRFRNIASYLDIQKYELYETFCVKCVKKDRPLFFNRYLDNRFQNCYEKLETELRIIQPLLIICIDEIALRLINARYKTGIEAFNHLKWESMNVLGKEYPLMLLSEDEIGKIALSENIKEKVSDFLVQDRKLPAKPRIKDL